MQWHRWLHAFVQTRPVALSHPQSPRRTMLRGAVLALSTLAGLASAPAWAYPTKPITIVVPTAPGGGNDAMARLIGQRMAALLGQPVVVENKAGAHGSIASEQVVRAAPDGHTLMLGYIATHAMNPALQKLRYDPVQDFEPIGLIGTSATVLVAHPQAGFKDAKDLIQQVKAKADKITIATAGNGTAPYFAAELFQMTLGVSVVSVPYKGSAPAMTDTMAGQTQLMFPSLFSAMPHIKSGKLQAVAIAGNRRAPQLKDLPTLKENGVDVDVTQWYGLFAPAKTPKPLVQKLNETLNQILREPEMVQKLNQQGIEVEASSPDGLKQLVQNELARWKQVVIKGKLQPD